MFKRILAGTIALILIGFILFLANDFVGNPISKILVNQAASKYVNQNYAQLNLELNKASFNFKDGSYYVSARSKTSIDTHFSMNFSGSGKFIYDTYQSNVLEKFNTWQRVNSEYETMVDTVVDHDFPYESDIAFGELLGKGEQSDELELDREYDMKAMAKEKGHIVLYITSDTPNEEVLTQTLIEVKKLFDQKEVPFQSIDFTLQTPLSENQERRNSIQIQNFLYQEISEDGLQDRVKENIAMTKAYYEQRDQEKDAEIVHAEDKAQ